MNDRTIFLATEEMSYIHKPGLWFYNLLTVNHLIQKPISKVSSEHKGKSSFITGWEIQSVGQDDDRTTKHNTQSGITLIRNILAIKHYRVNTLFAYNSIIYSIINYITTKKGEHISERLFEISLVIRKLF